MAGGALNGLTADRRTAGPLSLEEVRSVSGNVDMDVDERDWQPRSPGSPRGRLRMQVVSVEQAEPPIEPEWLWVDGWRFLTDRDPAPVPARELVLFTALPPQLRANIRPARSDETGA